MKLKDAIAKLDREAFKGNDLWNRVSWDRLSSASGLSLGYWDFGDSYESEDVREYPIKTWTCTDTEVGIKAYFLKDELLMFSSQTGRKNNIYYYFVSVEMKNKLIAYILENIDKSKEATDLVDMELELDDYPNKFWHGYIGANYGDELKRIS